MLFYIVEMALSPGHTEEDWVRWDREMKPASLLMSVPGFLSAQRFKGVTEPLGYYGIYQLANADVLTSDAYRNVGGGVRVKKWSSDNIAYWRRDIAEGAQAVPEAPPGSMLLVKNSATADFPDAGAPFVRWKTVGLDHAFAYRGLAVVPADQAERLAKDDSSLVLYKPIAPQLIASA